jgi:long-chain acyl-CoA synthetase
MDIGTLPTRNARHYRDREALAFEGRRFTWGELNARINQSANALLGLGLGKGDKIALLLPNALELVELYWAIAKIGAVAVPLSPLLRGPALASLVRDSDAVALVTCRDLAPSVESIRNELAAIDPSRMLVTDDPGRAGFADYAALVAAASDAEPPQSGVTLDDPYNIMYSSGTTGEPKGIIHTHDIRAHYGLVFSGSFRFDGQAVVLQSSSLVFNGSMLMFIPWMHNAAKLVLQRKFDPDAYLEALVSERVTHGMLVPSQIMASWPIPASRPSRSRRSRPSSPSAPRSPSSTRSASAASSPALPASSTASPRVAAPRSSTRPTSFGSPDRSVRPCSSAR